MARVIYQQKGNPIDVLEVGDSQSEMLGPHDIQVKMEAMPVNPSDLSIIRGVYRTPQKTPAVPGTDGAGIIAAVGSDVKGLKIGQRVVVMPIKTAGWTNGTWQEYLCIDESGVFPIPDGGDTNNWAQLFTILTAWIMAVEELKLGPGDTVLVTAAGSTVGRSLLQIAKLRGFSVIAVVRRPEHKEILMQLGAKDVICSANEDITQRALAATQLKGVTAVIDSVGGEVASQCFRALAERGTMFVYGLLALERDSSIDIRKMLFYNLSLRGFWIPDWWRSAELDKRMQVANTVVNLVVEGKLTADVDSTFKLSEIKQAVAKAEQPGNNGRVMLVP
jgi:NADPH:quinone reductase